MFRELQLPELKRPINSRVFSGGMSRHSQKELWVRSEKVLPWGRRLLMAVVATTLMACTATVDPVAPRSGSTEATDVPIESIAYDPNAPIFVVAVEPFVMAPAIGFTTNLLVNTGADPLSAMLVTALSKNENITTVDLMRTQGRTNQGVRRGEVGPFIIRATVTEFAESAEAETDSMSISTGLLGVVMTVAGAVADVEPLLWTGVGIAGANPSYRNEEQRTKGVVAFDLHIIDERTGRIIHTSRAQGTYEGASATVGGGVFGWDTEHSVSKNSALGQALRVALNDASRQIDQALKEKGRS